MVPQLENVQDPQTWKKVANLPIYFDSQWKLELKE